jgi:cation transport ATPase
MAFSSVSVVTNSLRLKRWRPSPVVGQEGAAGDGH